MKILNNCFANLFQTRGQKVILSSSVKSFRRSLLLIFEYSKSYLAQGSVLELVCGGINWISYDTLCSTWHWKQRQKWMNFSLTMSFSSGDWEQNYFPHHFAALSIHLLCWRQQSCTFTAFLFLLYVNLQKNERGAIRLFDKSPPDMNCVYPHEVCFIKTSKEAGALLVLLKNSHCSGIQDSTSETLFCARCCRGCSRNLS